MKISLFILFLAILLIGFGYYRVTHYFPRQPVALMPRGPAVQTNILEYSPWQPDVSTTSPNSIVNRLSTIPKVIVNSKTCYRFIKETICQ